MTRYVNADDLLVKIMDLNLDHVQGDDGRELCQVIQALPTADVREVIEADRYKHLICPHCLSEFYAKTKAEMFCPDCGKKFFFSEKWGKFPYVGESIEQGNGLP